MRYMNIALSVLSPYVQNLSHPSIDDGPFDGLTQFTSNLPVHNRLIEPEQGIRQEVSKLPVVNRELRQQVNDPRVELRQQVNNPPVAFRQQVNNPPVALRQQVNDPPVALRQQIDDPPIALRQQVDDPVVALRQQVNNPPVKLRQQVNDPQVELRQEVPVEVRQQVNEGLQAELEPKPCSELFIYDRKGIGQLELFTPTHDKITIDHYSELFVHSTQKGVFVLKRPLSVPIAYLTIAGDDYATTRDASNALRVQRVSDKGVALISTDTLLIYNHNTKHFTPPQQCEHHTLSFHITFPDASTVLPIPPFFRVKDGSPIPDLKEARLYAYKGKGVYAVDVDEDGQQLYYISNDDWTPFIAKALLFDEMPCNEYPLYDSNQRFTCTLKHKSSPTTTWLTWTKEKQFHMGDQPMTFLVQQAELRLEVGGAKIGDGVSVLCVEGDTVIILHKNTVVMEATSCYKSAWEITNKRNVHVYELYVPTSPVLIVSPRGQTVVYHGKEASFIRHDGKLVQRRIVEEFPFYVHDNEVVPHPDDADTWTEYSIDGWMHTMALSTSDRNSILDSYWRAWKASSPSRQDYLAFENILKKNITVFSEDTILKILRDARQLPLLRPEPLWSLHAFMASYQHTRPERPQYVKLTDWSGKEFCRGYLTTHGNMYTTENQLIPLVFLDDTTVVCFHESEEKCMSNISRTFESYAELVIEDDIKYTLGVIDTVDDNDQKTKKLSFFQSLGQYYTCRFDEYGEARQTMLESLEDVPDEHFKQFWMTNVKTVRHDQGHLLFEKLAVTDQRLCLFHPTQGKVILDDNNSLQLSKLPFIPAAEFTVNPNAVLLRDQNPIWNNEAHVPLRLGRVVSTFPYHGTYFLWIKTGLNPSYLSVTKTSALEESDNIFTTYQCTLNGLHEEGSKLRLQLDPKTFKRSSFLNLNIDASYVDVEYANPHHVVMYSEKTYLCFSLETEEIATTLNAFDENVIVVSATQTESEKSGVVFHTRDKKYVIDTQKQCWSEGKNFLLQCRAYAHELTGIEILQEPPSPTCADWVPVLETRWIQIDFVFNTHDLRFDPSSGGPGSFILHNGMLMLPQGALYIVFMNDSLSVTHTQPEPEQAIMLRMSRKTGRGHFVVNGQNVPMPTSVASDDECAAHSFRVSFGDHITSSAEQGLTLGEGESYDLSNDDHRIVMEWTENVRLSWEGTSPPRLVQSSSDDHTRVLVYYDSSNTYYLIAQLPLAHYIAYNTESHIELVVQKESATKWSLAECQAFTEYLDGKIPARCAFFKDMPTCLENYANMHWVHKVVDRKEYYNHEKRMWHLAHAYPDEIKKNVILLSRRVRHTARFMIPPELLTEESRLYSSEGGPVTLKRTTQSDQTSILEISTMVRKNHLGHVYLRKKHLITDTLKYNQKEGPASFGMQPTMLEEAIFQMVWWNENRIIVPRRFTLSEDLTVIKSSSDDENPKVLCQYEHWDEHLCLENDTKPDTCHKEALKLYLEPTIKGFSSRLDHVIETGTYALHNAVCGYITNFQGASSNESNLMSSLTVEPQDTGTSRWFICNNKAFLVQSDGTYRQHFRVGRFQDEQQTRHVLYRDSRQVLNVVKHMFDTFYPNRPPIQDYYVTLQSRDTDNPNKMYQLFDAVRTANDKDTFLNRKTIVTNEIKKASLTVYSQILSDELKKLLWKRTLRISRIIFKKPLVGDYKYGEFDDSERTDVTLKANQVFIDDSPLLWFSTKNYMFYYNQPRTLLQTESEVFVVDNTWGYFSLRTRDKFIINDGESWFLSDSPQFDLTEFIKTAHVGLEPITD